MFLSFCPVWNLLAIDTIHLSIDAITTDLLQAHNVEFAATGMDTRQPAITITVRTITAGDYQGPTAIRIECATTVNQDGDWHCADGQLTYASANHKEVKSSLGFDYTADHHWRVRLRGLFLELADFSGLLSGLHPAFHDYQISAGRLNGQLELSGNADRVLAAGFHGQIDELSLAGASTLEKVSAAVNLQIANTDATWTTRADFTLTAGAMYIVPGFQVLGDTPGFFIEAGAQPITLQLAANWDERRRLLTLEDLRYSHPGLLEFQGRIELGIADSITMPVINIKTGIEKLDAAFPVYIQPMLLNTDFGNLETAGKLALAFDYHDQRLARMDFNFDGIYVADKNDRFSLSGLNGNLAVRDSAEPVQSSLNWDGLSFHRLDIGSGSVAFTSAAGQVKVLRWDDLDFLDGKLEISSLDLRNIGTPDFEVMLDARLTPVSMQTFTEAMQWPLMSGTLAGSFQGLRYSHNNLELNGDVAIQAFDGSVLLSDLRIRDLFSEYSELSANIDFNALDLERLTGTFAFGKIEGTLNGQVRQLLLKNWRPYYFEASFLTPADDERPHRISQKALDNLNSLGGGLSGTMSRGAIRFFPEYSYGQIGLSCRLNNQICELGGVSDSGGGFYLLTHGGLVPPWVEVKGNGRSIPWDDLIGGLKRIAQGEMRIE